MEQTVIGMQNVYKNFRVNEERCNTLKEKLLHWNFGYRVLEVLRGVDIEINRGEAVVLIGRNGCGKSTILKMLSHIMSPDNGTVFVRGRVSSIIELGTGFHPDMTGRENVYMNASVYGIREKEMDRRIDAIIGFAELEAEIDYPVRTYSSGMYMRLAFSAAIHVDADILLIDEILAVGDAAFQVKCFRKLQELKKQGKTIVIVSHALGQIESICERAIWIEEGKVKEDGKTQSVCEHYLDAMNQVAQKRKDYEERGGRTEIAGAAGRQTVQRTCVELMDEFNADASREGSYGVYFTKVEVLDEQGRTAALFQTGGDITVRLAYSCLDVWAGQEIVFRISLLRTDYIICYTVDSAETGRPIYAEKDGSIELTLQDVHLLDAYYLLCIEITDSGQKLFDRVSAVRKIGIRNVDRRERGIVHMKHTWKNGI